MSLSNHDPHIDALITKETARQQDTITLIASENYASPEVMQATGSVLTNKYAEGYPGKRYYAGCEFVDAIEQVAIDRCKKLFGVEHANVQPHAGSQANMAAYLALLNPGDTIMGMSLAAGGHLTHGHTVNFSGKLFKAVQYGVDPHTEQFDFDAIQDLAEQNRPKLIIVGASAYSRIIDFWEFKKIADSVGAYLLADIAHIAGLVAIGLHPTPVGIADIITSTTHKTLRGPRGGLIMCGGNKTEVVDRAIIPGMQGGPLMHVIAAKAIAFEQALQPNFRLYQQQVLQNAKIMAHTFAQLGYRIVSGGTDNHLFVVDLRLTALSKRTTSITGLKAERALEQAGLTVSRSCIPFDPEKPWITSGIRIGTPAMTTRGMGTQEAIELVHFMDEAINNHTNISLLQQIREKIRDLGRIFPIQ